MAAKKVGKHFYCGQKMAHDSVCSLEAKNYVEIVPSSIISEINAFLSCTQKFKMVAKNGGKIIFGTKCQMTAYTPGLGSNPLRIWI